MTREDITSEIVVGPGFTNIALVAQDPSSPPIISCDQNVINGIRISTTGTSLVSGFVVTGCNAHAIEISNAVNSVTLQDCTTSGNNFGIYITNSTDFTLDHCTAKGAAPYSFSGIGLPQNNGAGIHVDTSSGTISGCTISGNQNYLDAGIYLSASTVIISDTIIANNTPLFGEYGGLDSIHSDVTMTNVSILDNAYGGASFEYGTIVMTGCSIKGSISFPGLTLSGLIITMTDCDVSDNIANYGEGASFSSVNGTVVNTNFSRNSGGGAIMNGCNMKFVGVTFDGNQGSAVNVQSSYMNFTNCVFTNNVAQTGGAFYVLFSHFLYLANCLIENNQATSPYTSGQGGGIYAMVSPLFILSSTITNNKCGGSTGTGGGIYLVFLNSGGGSDDSIISNTLISGNQASRGAGLYIAQGTVATIQGSTVSDNLGDLGAGILASTSDLTIFNNTVSRHSFPSCL